MKNTYSFPITICLLFFLAFSWQKATAQTTLVAGDIAITGYLGFGASVTPDQFSFVLLRNIAANTAIKFTDRGWGTDNVFSALAGESTVTWTATTALSAGVEVKIEGLTATLAGAGNPGTVSGTALSLSANGDQVLAYQGADASPTFISGIHSNVYTTANLDPTTTTAAAWDALTAANATFNSSALPTGLTTGVNAIWIGTQGSISSEKDNARFVCAGDLSTVASIKALIYNQSNWITSDGDPAGFTLPTACNYISALPVHLVRFFGTNNAMKAALSWTAENETNFSHYELERSIDGYKFNIIATVNYAGHTGSNSYTYNDVSAFINGDKTIYYRLKSVDNDGKFEYSNIVNITNTRKGEVGVYPNPVEGELHINGLLQNTSYTIKNTDGKIIQTGNVESNQRINVSSLPTGLYYIYIDNQALKFVKQ